MTIQLENYYPLIYKIINKFDYQYRDELFNECYIQLNHIQTRYTPVKGKFETYAYQRLFFHCKDFISRFQPEELTLDDFIKYEDSDSDERLLDSIQDEVQLEDEIINADYINQHNNNLTEIERFIQQKYYEDGVSVKTIIAVYEPYHLISSEQTIRKILKK